MRLSSFQRRAVRGALASLAVLVLDGLFAARSRADDAVGELVIAGREVVLENARLIDCRADGAFVFNRGDANDRPLIVQSRELIRWSTPVVPRAGDEVHFVDGSRLVLAPAWTDEPTLRLDASRGSVKTRLFGDVPFDRSQLRAVFWQLPADAVRRQAAVDRLFAAQAARGDALLLDNGDVLVGSLASVGGVRQGESDSPQTENAEAAQSRSAVFVGNLGRVELPLSRVRGVALAPAAEAAPAVDAPQIAAGFRDGSVAYGTRIVGGNGLVVATGSLGELRAARVGDLVYLQRLGGPAAYVSDLEPLQYRHEPYLELAWPFRRDRNALGLPAMAGDRRFLKSLGMHSKSRLEYALDGTHERFAAGVAVDDAAGEGGSVVFKVEVRRGGQWSPAGESPVVRGGDPPRVLAVVIRGADRLALLVDYADRGDELDYANWLDARLE